MIVFYFPLLCLTLCGLGCDANLVMFVACEDNSSAVSNTKNKTHLATIWNVT